LHLQANELQTGGKKTQLLVLALLESKGLETKDEDVTGTSSAKEAGSRRFQVEKRG